MNKKILLLGILLLTTNNVYSTITIEELITGLTVKHTIDLKNIDFSNFNFNISIDFDALKKHIIFPAIAGLCLVISLYAKLIQTPNNVAVKENYSSKTKDCTIGKIRNMTQEYLPIVTFAISFAYLFYSNRTK
jgi:hypothetical protein